MSDVKDNGFADRLGTAHKARKAMLERVRAMPSADDPAVTGRKAARQAISAAREVRLAERESDRIAAQARKAEERLVHEVNEQEKRLAKEAAETVERAEEADRQAALEVAQKAARDARYAARKARK
jgi:hypothetical protein